MSLELKILNYLDTQITDGTVKIIYPNTPSDAFGNSFSDSTIILQPTVLDLGSEIIGVPVRPSTEQRREFRLHINVFSTKDVGAGAVHVQAGVLDTIFNAQQMTHDSSTFYFKASRLRPPVYNELYYQRPWECEFIVYE